jgi:hypothetical protein
MLEILKRLVLAAVNIRVSREDEGLKTVICILSVWCVTVIVRLSGAVDASDVP